MIQLFRVSSKPQINHMNRKITTLTLVLVFFMLSMVNAQSNSNDEQKVVESVLVERSPEIGINVAKNIPGYVVESLENGSIRVYAPEELVPLTKARPFVALGISWSAEVENLHQIEIAVRGSANAREWSEWITVDADHHAVLEMGKYSGSMVFFPSETQYIQYSTTLKPQLTFQQPKLNDITFHFINPGLTDQEVLGSFKTLVPDVMEPRDRVQKIAPDSVEKEIDFTVSTASYDLPAYVPRTTWGASLGLGNTANRSVTNVTHLIVHHSAGNYTPTTDFAAVVRSYWSYHTGPVLGWADIGYNWLVDRNGVIYQGRAFNFDGNRDVVGAHFSGQNGRTMGICLIGNFNSVQPTAVAVNQLRTMLAWKANERGIDVRAREMHTVRNLFTISGHRDGGATDCPGHQFYTRLPEMRNRTHAFLNPPEIQIVRAETVTATTTEFYLELGVKNFESNVIAFIEYGLTEDNLDQQSDDVEFSASTEINMGDMSLTGLSPATLYHYRVVAVNSDTFTVTEKSTFTTADPTSIDGTDEIVAKFELEQNYPNPFNPTTSISFVLAEPANIRVLVYNSQGQLMSVVTDQVYNAGRFSANYDASGVASGVLIYALEVDGIIVDTRKMLLLR
jgi:hypothetical protein